MFIQSHQLSNLLLQTKLTGALSKVGLPVTHCNERFLESESHKHSLFAPSTDEHRDLYVRVRYCFDSKTDTIDVTATLSDEKSGDDCQALVSADLVREISGILKEEIGAIQSELSGAGFTFKAEPSRMPYWEYSLFTEEALQSIICLKCARQSLNIYNDYKNGLKNFLEEDKRFWTDNNRFDIYNQYYMNKAHGNYTDSQMRELFPDRSKAIEEMNDRSARHVGIRDQFFVDIYRSFNKALSEVGLFYADLAVRKITDGSDPFDVINDTYLQSQNFRECYIDGVNLKNDFLHDYDSPISKAYSKAFKMNGKEFLAFYNEMADKKNQEIESQGPSF